MGHTQDVDKQKFDELIHRKCITRERLDNQYFVCEVLHTEEFSVHFHSFVITREIPILISFCTPDELADHHTLGLYNLCLLQDTHPSLYIVPHYHLI